MEVYSTEEILEIERSREMICYEEIAELKDIKGLQINKRKVFLNSETEVYLFEHLKIQGENLPVPL